jgi:glycosyltransferase involved in cell wall biosynthesis
MACLEIAVIVSTYERPGHLRRALLSIAAQRDVAGKIEVVVTDDGSTDETPEVVETFSRQVDFPLRLTTHPHDGFRVAVCRNEGVAASTAPYLLFTDGDCLLPPEHLAAHLALRRPGFVVAGDCYRLDRSTSGRIGEADVRSGRYLQWIPRSEQRRIANKARRAWLYGLLRHPMRPRLTGCNFALWRQDFERINGFDENYVGWGLEDTDLQLRLGRLGLRFKSILHKTAVCHLWHPPHPTFARNNQDTPNLRYYRRGQTPTRCCNGLVKEDGVALQPAAADEEPAEVLLPFPRTATEPGRIAA